MLHVGLGVIVFAVLLLLHIGGQESAMSLPLLRQMVVEPALVGFIAFAANVVLTVVVRWISRRREEGKLENQLHAMLPRAEGARQKCRDYYAHVATDQEHRLFAVACGDVHSLYVEMASRFGVWIPFAVNPNEDMATLDGLIGMMRARDLARIQRQFPIPQESDQPPA